MIALSKIQLVGSGTRLRQTIRCASIPILLGSAVAIALAPAYGQGIVDPAAMARRQSNLTYAESFEKPITGIGSRDNGLSGKAANMDGAGSGVRIPQKGVINKAAGTISWWGRMDAEAIKTSRLMSMGSGYINYFGKEGSSDIRHSHKLGHYFSEFGGPTFVSYPDGGLQAGDWHAFAYTWNGVQPRLYVDGMPVASLVFKKPFSELPPY